MHTNGSNLKEKIENATQNHTIKQLFLSRSDMEKSRLRTETDDGTEMGYPLNLEQLYTMEMYWKLILI